MLHLSKALSTRKKKIGDKKSERSKRGGGPNRRGRGPRIFTMPATVSRTELLDDDGVSDRGFRQFIYDFSALAAQLDLVRAHLSSQLGLSPPQYNIVMIIAQYQGTAGISVSDVAQHLHVTTAFITSEVGKLEQAGLVEKRANPNDGRGVLLCLTADGETRALQIGPKRLMINDYLFRGLSKQNFRELSKIVASLIDAFTETTNMLKIMALGAATRRGQVEG